MKFHVGQRVKYVDQNAYGDMSSNPLWGGEQGYISGIINHIGLTGVYITWANTTQNSYDLDSHPNCIQPLEHITHFIL